jgi:hypothetical protein
MRGSCGTMSPVSRCVGLASQGHQSNAKTICKVRGAKHTVRTHLIYYYENHFRVVAYGSVTSICNAVTPSTSLHSGRRGYSGRHRRLRSTGCLHSSGRAVRKSVVPALCVSDGCLARAEEATSRARCADERRRGSRCAAGRRPDRTVRRSAVRSRAGSKWASKPN